MIRNIEKDIFLKYENLNKIILYLSNLRKFYQDSLSFIEKLNFAMEVNGTNYIEDGLKNVFFFNNGTIFY